MSDDDELDPIHLAPAPRGTPRRCRLARAVLLLDIVDDNELPVAPHDLDALILTERELRQLDVDAILAKVQRRLG